MGTLIVSDRILSNGTGGRRDTYDVFDASTKTVVIKLAFLGELDWKVVESHEHPFDVVIPKPSCCDADSVRVVHGWSVMVFINHGRCIVSIHDRYLDRRVEVL